MPDAGWRMHDVRRMSRLRGMGAVLPILAAVAAGCGDRGPEIRRYQEIAPAAPASPVTWSVPEGWEERPGGDLRLATFLVREGVECTVTAFPGAVGGLEANVRRWLGQLQVPDPGHEALAAFIAGAEIVETEGGRSGRLLDFRRLVPHAEVAILAGVFPGDDATLFVKLAAPPDVLAAEATRFEALCRSLR